MKKLILRIILILALLGIGFTIWAYKNIFQINTKHSERTAVYINSGSDFPSLIMKLVDEDILKNPSSFKRVANWMKFENVKPGKYHLEKELNNLELVRLLRSGNQVPINITISAGRKIEDIVNAVHHNLEADSAEIHDAFLDDGFLKKYNLTSESVISIIIPNTYQFFWNTSGMEFVKRIKLESDNFWDKNERTSKASILNLNQLEVITLASIVEKESIQKNERPTIAGVYINRLKRNIPLQADPTVVFAVGDFSIRRVLNKHLEKDSPYNTYRNRGLPPGPICMPSISSIDAVLNAEKHDYLFFCAKPGYNGGHLFAKTNAEHERNARKYRRWLNKEGIRI